MPLLHVYDEIIHMVSTHSHVGKHQGQEQHSRIRCDTMILKNRALTLFWKKDAWKCAVVADIDIKLISSALGLCK